ncbi:uncharacterized protein rhbdd2 isoform X3 [Mustelus asterias]
MAERGEERTRRPSQPPSLVRMVKSVIPVLPCATVSTALLGWIIFYLTCRYKVLDEHTFTLGHFQSRLQGAILNQGPILLKHITFLQPLIPITTNIHSMQTNRYIGSDPVINNLSIMVLHLLRALNMMLDLDTAMISVTYHNVDTTILLGTHLHTGIATILDIHLDMGIATILDTHLDMGTAMILDTHLGMGTATILDTHLDTGTAMILDTHLGMGTATILDIILGRHKLVTANMIINMLERHHLILLCSNRVTIRTLLLQKMLKVPVLSS